MATKVSPLAPASFPDLPPIAGIRFAAAAVGVKYQGRDDVMLVEIAGGASVAGVFTKSSTRAAPVLDCQRKLASFRVGDAPAAILVNSGNANAFTGAAGDTSVEAICEAVAQVVSTSADRVFTASTGVIGVPLPHERITEDLQRLGDALAADAAEAAAKAIMTTDTFAKGSVAKCRIDGHEITIIGFAKGSGMIAPDMATMLGYLFTDAAVAPDVLQDLLQRSNAQSFNAITVDSDTSTSDTVMLVATGQAGNAVINDASSEAATSFAKALQSVMLDLALQIVRDGEGATKLIKVTTTGAKSAADADLVCRAIANSPLVKTAVAGEDANWGRVVMAVGKSGAAADRDRLSIRFGDVLVAEKGWVAASYSEEQGAAYMRRDEIEISVDLGLGSDMATVWTCDLTHGYIAINADYRS